MERGEALSAPLALPTEKIAHLDAAGDCCTAGFQLAYVRFGSGADARIHLPMSALPTKADMFSAIVMSVLCHKATSPEPNRSPIDYKS